MTPKKPLVITVIVLALVIILNCNLVNATEQAVISFNDAEHLAVLKDSVLAVRDTIWEGWWPCIASDTSIIRYSDWIEYFKRIEDIAEEQSDSCYIYFFRPVITRREFVRMKILPTAFNIVWKNVFTTLGEYDPLRGKNKKEDY